jgi:hypothetical protein
MVEEMNTQNRYAFDMICSNIRNGNHKDAAKLMMEGYDNLPEMLSYFRIELEDSALAVHAARIFFLHNKPERKMEEGTKDALILSAQREIQRIDSKNNTSVSRTRSRVLGAWIAGVSK